MEFDDMEYPPLAYIYSHGFIVCFKRIHESIKFDPKVRRVCIVGIFAGMCVKFKHECTRESECVACDRFDICVDDDIEWVVVSTRNTIPDVVGLWICRSC